MLRESSAELWQDILRYPVSSSIVLACLAMTVAVFRGWLKLFTALLFSAVALFVLVLFLVLRELLQALVLYSRTAWGASDRSSRERFAWYRDAVRRVRADWVRSLLWQEMAKSYKEMRQESLRPRAARPAEGEVPEGLGDDA